MLNRREALRTLAAGAAWQLAPAKMFAVMREARTVLAVQTGLAPRTLNAHQFATVKAMAEVILPRTETSGATDVGVGEFIDLMLTEWFEEAERARFLGGLADVDARSQTLFGKNFVECPAPQQGEILIALGEQMMEEERMVKERSLANQTEPPVPQNFYLTFRRLTLTGYYTSEAGATEELHFQIIPGRYDGCAVSEEPDQR